MNREVHVRFCEGPKVKLLWPTHPFLPTLAGFLYLAVVLDAWSRRIVGWAFSTDLKTRVVLDALDMALVTRKPDNVVHHSDRGSQYTSVAFGARCKEAGVRPSIGSVGDAYDNAMCRSVCSGESSLITSPSRAALCASIELAKMNCSTSND